MSKRQILRTQLLEQRQRLNATEIEEHSHVLTQKLCQNPLFQQAETIAFYHACRGEIKLNSLMQTAHVLGKKCYLPALVAAQKTLQFKEYKPGEPLQLNHLKILEPQANADACSAENLDLVLLPMVGWDLHGNRLGMGAGYYDRTFAFLLDVDRLHTRPWLIGVAHELQRCDQIEAMPWDVWLVGIATEQKYHEVISINELLKGK